MPDELLDLSESKLIIEGTKEEQKQWSQKVDDYVEDLQVDKNQRKSIYQKRKDFYMGDQGSYSNITGVIQDTKQKKGHNNQVTNYAGKTVVKISYGMANNPPKYVINSLVQNDSMEDAKAQGVEDYIDSVCKKNKFWKKTYRSSCFIQSEFGDAAIKVYPVGSEIKMCGHYDMSTFSAIWSGEDPNEFDGTVVESQLTARKIFDEYGIKVNEKLIPKDSSGSSGGSWRGTRTANVWGKTGSITDTELPTGDTDVPTLKVVEFDTKDVYIIKIEKQLVQLNLKDDVNYPKILFWTVVKNIPNPPSPWSIADIDYLMDPQVELNDNDCRTSDHLRVGNVQRYVAYNMTDFDPESLKTSSGQVIFVNDPDGKSRLEPLQTNINNFPDEQYHSRKMGQMYDMGLPKVNYGQSGADSGRSKAIDYQSSIDITIFKRDSWELALSEIFDKIQILGNFLHPELDVFKDEAGDFVLREVEFDWNDILPISQSDKIVNILNKYTMGLPLKQAYKEMGYRNVDAMYNDLVKELKDPNMMIIRAKAWQLAEGLLQAQMNAQAMMPAPVQPASNQPSPVLNSSQNTQGSKPVSQKGGTTTYSSAMGEINKSRQNMAAKGQ